MTKAFAIKAKNSFQTDEFRYMITEKFYFSEINK